MKIGSQLGNGIVAVVRHPVFDNYLLPWASIWWHFFIWGCLFVVLWPPPRTLMNFESSLTGAKWQARK
jgi:hypothetical protein